MKKVISQFISLGLSEYDARAYSCLLRDYPCTAYELAKTSGIPTSKIYEVLKKLVANGTVTVIADGQKHRYMPIALNDFIEKQRDAVEAAAKSIKESMSHVMHGAETLSIWNIIDYDFLLEKAKNMIETASSTLLVSIWEEEIVKLEDAIRNAEYRDVQVAVLHFGDTKLRLGKLYRHPVEDTVYREKGGRCITVVADSKEVLMGTIMKFGMVEGVWSRNRGFVTMAEEFIKHDIYIMKIVSRFGRKLQEQFGNRYEKLRDVFSDRTL